MRHPALIVALLAAAPATAAAQTLADALDACESFTANQAIPDTVDTEFTLFGDFDYATMDTELGPVLLTFASDYGMDGITYCDLTGADPRDKTNPVTVPFLRAQPLIDAWLAGREAAGGGKILPAFGGQRMFAACREDGGYFISAQSTPLGEQTSGLTEDALPLIVRMTEWTGNAAKPCDF